MLGILAHSTLSIGLIAISLMASLRIDLMGYLFGDILAVTRGDLVWIYVSGIGIVVVLALIWRPLLAVTVHEDLARAEGVPCFAVRLVFMLLIAVIIAFAMKIVGILLITSLLIIPAATARRRARSPEQMAVMAALIGAVAVVGGLFTSLRLDTPSGPSIVVVAVALFALSLLLPGATARLRRQQ
jgi:zinc transport system permease protein